MLCAVTAAMLCGCGGEKGNEWLNSPSATTDGSSDETSFEGEYDAPAFRSGRYIMTSDSTNTTTYLDSNGSQIYSGKMFTQYKYYLDIDVGEDRITCKYTFKSIYGSSSEEDSVTVELDTEDSSLKNSSNAVFYDLIGASFTVTADRNARLTGIGGVENIISDIDGAEQLIDSELLFNMAGDLFYEMPDRFSRSTSWQATQYGLNNQYTVERMARSMFGISIVGEQPAMPAPETDSQGYITTYGSMGNVTGTLWMDCSDRAVQELSTSQKSSGTIADENNSGVYFKIVSSAVTKITKAD